MPKQVAIITGAGAGIGRATAREFAKQGCDVGLLGRNRYRLEEAADEVRAYGVQAAIAVADVADSAAVDAAAEQFETELGPITIWVNNAMATMFAPVAELTAEEFLRVTQVTYLGTVHGSMAALRRMRRRGAGAIVNIGSTLGYRSVPLQSAVCGAKSAIRGFTDSLRSEILHDGDDIHLTMVHLPSVNTPLFSWALNRTGKRLQPMLPVYEPEIAARAIVFAALHRRREIWLGFSTVRAIMTNRIAPALADRYLARAGYSRQLGKDSADAGAPNNLYDSVAGAYSANGRFDERARTSSLAMFTSRHKIAAVAAGLALAASLTFRLAAPAGSRKSAPRAT